MNLRISLLMTAAAAFLVVGTGCESTKTKAEMSSLTAQNRDYAAKLEAETARANAAEAKAQAATDAAARQQQAAQTPTTPDMGPGPLVDLRGPGARGPRTTPASAATPTEKAHDTVLELKGDVLFDSGKATIKPSAQKELDALAATIKKQYTGKTLRIEGHTDATPLKSTSKWKSNKELGEARAKAVMAYLAKKGVPEKAMQAVSMGSSQPKSTKDQAANRRVDIVVKDAA